MKHLASAFCLLFVVSGIVLFGYFDNQKQIEIKKLQVDSVKTQIQLETLKQYNNDSSKDTVKVFIKK